MIKKIIRWFINYLDDDTSLEIIRIIVESKKNKLDATTLKEVINKLKG